MSSISKFTAFLFALALGCYDMAHSMERRPVVESLLLPIPFEDEMGEEGSSASSSSPNVAHGGRRKSRRSARGGVRRTKPTLEKFQNLFLPELGRTGKPKELSLEKFTKYLDWAASELDEEFLKELRFQVGQAFLPLIHAVALHPNSRLFQKFLQHELFTRSVEHWLAVVDRYGKKIVDLVGPAALPKTGVAAEMIQRATGKAGQPHARLIPFCDRLPSPVAPLPQQKLTVSASRPSAGLTGAALKKAIDAAAGAGTQAFAELLAGVTADELKHYRLCPRRPQTRDGYLMPALNGTVVHFLVKQGDAALLSVFLASRVFQANRVYWLESGDSRGSTPLQHAANFGKTDMVELLVQAGARVDHVDQQTGRTFFQYAMVRNDERMLEALCRGNRFVPELLDIPDKVYDFPPVDYAVVNNRYGMVMLLRAYGANLFWRDARGRSLLHLAIAKARNPENPGERGDAEMLKLLLSTECRQLVDDVDVAGHTPLESALHAQRPDLVKLLIEAGADLSFSRLDNGDNYLHRAVAHGCVDSAAFLLKAAAERDDGGALLKTLLRGENMQGLTAWYLTQRAAQGEAIERVLADAEELLEGWVAEQEMRADMERFVEDLDPVR